MLPEKRIRNQPKPYPVFNVRSSRKDKSIEKKRKLSTLEFETIPLPSKYEFTSDTLLLYGEYANKVNNLLLENSYQEKIAALKTATEERRKELHRKHPCLQFRTQFRGHENHLAEVVVNERFLQALGYTMEAFATSVLNEGLPQLIPLNFETNSRFAQNTLEKCLKKETTGADADDFQSPEFEAIVLTKCGYVKTVKIQVHILMTHESTEYGSFTFFVLTDQGPPYLKLQEQQPLQVNQEFMDIMLAREQEAINFLSAYYDYSGSLLYTNLHRVCRVKELESSV